MNYTIIVPKIGKVAYKLYTKDLVKVEKFVREFLILEMSDVYTTLSDIWVTCRVASCRELLEAEESGGTYIIKPAIIEPVIGKFIGGFVIVATHPLSHLEHFKDHRRLQTFYHKGVKCVSCGVEGSFLVTSIDKGGNKHVDLVTKDLLLMNVDHIIPKSKKGSNALSNLQPMCCKCNTIKGSKL